MTIEKRFHQRLDIEADVDIHILHRDRHIVSKAENITPYGMLLSTNNLTVPTGMLLELSVDINGYISMVPGLVIWTGRNKIGVMFPQIQPTLFTAAEALAGKAASKKKRPAKKGFMTPRTSSKHMLFQPEPHATV